MAPREWMRVQRARAEVAVHQVEAAAQDTVEAATLASQAIPCAAHVDWLEREALGVQALAAEDLDLVALMVRHLLVHEGLGVVEEVRAEHGSARHVSALIDRLSCPS